MQWQILFSRNWGIHKRADLLPSDSAKAMNRLQIPICMVENEDGARYLSKSKGIFLFPLENSLLLNHFDKFQLVVSLVFRSVPQTWKKLLKTAPPEAKGNDRCILDF